MSTARPRPARLGKAPPYVFANTDAIKAASGGADVSGLDCKTPPPFLARVVELQRQQRRDRGGGDGGGGAPADEDEGEEAMYSQFYLGARGSGSPVHVHQDAWNALGHGSKLWHLLPPFRGGGAVYSRVPIGEGLRLQPSGASASADTDADDTGGGGGATGAGAGARSGAVPGVGAMRCVQRAGDIIYVPGLWGHGVLNLQDSVGCAVEMKSVEQLL
jgi:hypothetical protein